MTGNHIISWRIKKLDGNLQLSASNLNLSLDNPTATVNITRLGDGDIYAWSRDSDIATISISNTILTITRRKEGNTNVAVIVDSSDYYNAPQPAYIEVNTGSDIREITRPSADKFEFAYSGNDRNLSVTNDTSAYFEMVNNSKTSASALGEYSVQYHLTDSHSVWKGTAPKKRIPIPEVPVTLLPYTGENYALPVNNAEDYISKYFTVKGDTLVSSAGDHTVTFSLKDTDTTMWMDGKIADISVKWTATAQKKNLIPNSLADFSEWQVTTMPERITSPMSKTDGNIWKITKSTALKTSVKLGGKSFTIEFWFKNYPGVSINDGTRKLDVEYTTYTGGTLSWLLTNYYTSYRQDINNNDPNNTLNHFVYIYNHESSMFEFKINDTMIKTGNISLSESDYTVTIKGVNIAGTSNANTYAYLDGFNIQIP